MCANSMIDSLILLICMVGEHLGFWVEYILGNKVKSLTKIVQTSSLPTHLVFSLHIVFESLYVSQNFSFVIIFCLFWWNLLIWLKFVVLFLLCYIYFTKFDLFLLWLLNAILLQISLLWENVRDLGLLLLGYGIYHALIMPILSTVLRWYSWMNWWVPTIIFISLYFFFSVHVILLFLNILFNMCVLC